MHADCLADVVCCLGCWVVVLFVLVALVYSLTVVCLVNSLRLMFMLLIVLVFIVSW